MILELIKLLAAPLSTRALNLNPPAFNQILINSFPADTELTVCRGFCAAIDPTLQLTLIGFPVYYSERTAAVGRNSEETEEDQEEAAPVGIAE